MAAIVPDLPSSSSLCTPDLLLIKPPAPLFSLPFSSSLPLFFFYLQLSESGRRRCNSPVSIHRRHDLLSSLAPCDHRSGALLENRGRIVSRIIDSRAIRPFEKKEEIFPVDRCLPRRGSSGLLSVQTIGLFDTIV